MKKLLPLLLAFLLSATVFLASCTDDSSKKEETKAPAAEDSTAPVEDTTGVEEEDKTDETQKAPADETTESEDTTTAPETTKAPETAAPVSPPSGEGSGGGSINSGGTHSGGTQGGSQSTGPAASDGPVPQAASTKDAYPEYIYTKSGKKLVHTYSDRAIGAEDNSTTYSYMPMLSTSVTPDPNGAYNNHACMLDQIRPGFVCNNVIVGYDGYMFYGDTVADFKGEGFLHGDVYNRAVQVLKDRNSWAEKHGKKFYFVIAPNKNTVYPEYMPEGYTMADYRRYDQFVEMIDAAGITAVDLRDAMANARKTNPKQNLYYKYDTHWNNHAGYIAYLETMKMIQKDFPNVVIHQKSEYQINYCETYMKDQAYYLGYYSHFKDYGPVYTLKSNKTATLIDYEPRQSWGQFVFAYECQNGPNRGFSDKLYWLQYENEYNTNAPNAYIMRDSYSIAMIPFLKDSFHTSTYNWTFSFSEKEIMDAEADVILVIVAERNLKNYVNNKAVND